VLCPVFVDPCICRIEPSLDVDALKFDGIETSDVIDGLAYGAIWRTIFNKSDVQLDRSDSSQTASIEETESIYSPIANSSRISNDFSSSGYIDDLLSCVKEANMRLDCSILRFICSTGSEFILFNL